MGEAPVDLTRRKDNLYSPLPRDFGTHGRFDDEARPRSLQARVRLNPSALAYLGAAGLMLLALGLYRRPL